MAAPVIDPNTGERVQLGAPQIDPATGERMQSAPPKAATPIGGDLRPTSFEDQLTEIRPDDPNENLAQRGLNFVGNIGAAGMGTLLHPVNTAKAVGNSLLHPADTFKQTFDALNTRPADTTASMIGQSAAMAPVAELAPRVLAPALEKAGPKLVGKAAVNINRTAGSLAKDYNRGADPGLAYLDAGGRTAWSMPDLADKAAALKPAVGQQLGSLYDSATKQGMTFPVDSVQGELAEPIDELRTQQEGPGGTGASPLLDDYQARLQPKPVPGMVGAQGYTPNGLFDLKSAISSNTKWNDPTQFDLNAVRQEQVGRLGGMLSDAIPEAKPLNFQYQGLNNLANRTALRAATGSRPLTSLMGKAARTLGGAAVGATHGPVGAALGAVGAGALESVPLRTAVASNLYRVGRASTAIGGKLRGLYGVGTPAVAAASALIPPRRP